jgi:serine/threonine-protein kinase HipA
MTYTPIHSLRVLYHGMLVGTLALRDRRVWFQYDAAFLNKGLALSPIKLPLKPEVMVCDDRTFDGLFGLFNDSLPDGWGRLLLDRHMRSQGIAPERLTLLDRLAHVGHHGMGALVYEPDHSVDDVASINLDLDHLAAESRAVLEGAPETVIAELLSLNGSSSGARPKIVVGVSPDKEHIIHGTDYLPDGYTHWMIKFTSSHDPDDNGAIEYAYSLMAKGAGILMPETYLFPAVNGMGYFGVKRFDRDGHKRIHMHTISGLLHADHRIPSLDYEDILKATQFLTRSMVDVEANYRLAVFNVLAYNRDDHAKNFAFIMNEKGEWSAAPAYDLTFSSGPGGEQSTTIMGEGRHPDRTHLLALGKKMNIKKAQDIIDQVSQAISRWDEYARMAGVSDESTELIKKSMG